MRSVGNNKDLHVFIKSTACPKAVPLISLYLIKRFTNGNTTSFKLNVNQGQTIYKDSNVIACVVLTAILGVLIDDLHKIVMYIFLINQVNILACAVITL